MRRLIMEYASAFVSFLGSMGVLGILHSLFFSEEGFFYLLLQALGKGGY